MIVGIDIHGVLDTYPLVFKPAMANHMKQKGSTVYIITGPPEVEARVELEALGIFPILHYEKIISVVDWLKKYLKEDEMWLDEKNEWWCDDATWWCSKARICNEYDVEQHIDDSEKYLIGWDVTDCKTEFHLVKDGVMERKR